MSASSSPRPLADLNLLFGILAVQMDFISRDALLAALQAWVFDKARPLGQILLDQGRLNPQRRQLLDALVQQHVQAHQDDPRQSLQAASSAAVRQQLRAVEDPDVQASLAAVDSCAESTGPFVPASANGAGLRYTVLRPHARGGLGEVSVALDEELHREVALKEIQPCHADNPLLRGRFLVEAEITGGLEHPGVVPIYGLGQYADGRLYYAMRFIRGENLREALGLFYKQLDEARPRLRLSARNVTFRRLLARFVAVCNAVAYAHSRGVLHRDLKPSNIMLGKYGETLVVDWGLAKASGRRFAEDDGERTLQPSSGSGVEPTQLGKAVGTPAYMSPEQAEGRVDEVGPASDVYGLGATLYTLLTNAPPVRGQDVGELLRKVQRGEFPPPRQVRREVPAALEAVCLKAMALRPADRYSTPLELAADVEHWLADEPVSAYRDPLPTRLARWSRRHRTLVSVGIALLLATTVGLSAGTLLLAEKNRQVGEQRALAEERDAEARAINGFLKEHILAAAMPEGLGLGKDVTLRKALDEGARRIGEALKGQPAVEASIRETLGVSYFRLGAYPESEAQLRRCVALRREALPPGHADTLRALRWLARPLVRQRKLDEARDLLREALIGFREQFGEESEDTLETIRLFAQLENQRGNPEESERLLKRALPAVRRLYGNEHPQTLSFVHDLGVYLVEQDELEEAEPLVHEAVSGGERLLPRDHPFTLTFRSNLAGLMHKKGEVKEAERLKREVVAANRKVRGLEHDETQSTIASLAEFLEHRGAYLEAEQLRREVLTARSRTLDSEDPMTLRAMDDLGSCLTNGGKPREAEELHRKVLTARSRLFGEGDATTCVSRNNLAWALSHQGRLVEAEALDRENLAIRQRVWGPDHRHALHTKANLAYVLARQQKFPEAERLIREILTLRLRRLGVGRLEALPDARTLTALSRWWDAALGTMQDLAVLLMWQRKMKDAEALQNQILAIRRHVLGDAHYRTLSSLRQLGWLAHDQGRPKDAETLFRKATDGLEHVAGSDHVQIINARRGLASVYLYEGRLKEAEGLLRQNLAWAHRHDSVDSQSRWIPLDHLAFALALQGRWREAEPLAAEVYGIRSYAHSRTSGLVAPLGWIRLELGQPKEAEPLLCEALDYCRTRLVFPDWIEPHTETLLGGALAAQGRNAEAEPLLVRGVEALLEPRGCVPPTQCVRKAVERLVALYDGWGKKDKADAWRKRLPPP